MTQIELIEGEITSLSFKADKCGNVSPRNFMKLLGITSLLLNLIKSGPTTEDDNANLIVPIGKFLVLKKGIITPDELEERDYVEAIVENKRISGTYSGGSKELLSSFDIDTSSDLEA